jgi:ribosomal protein S18 acetylase RimI-like enzyme
MKVIDAAWERRNLGLDVTEVLLDDHDAANEAETLAALKPHMDHYVVVKIPVSCAALAVKLQELGFVFLECQYRLSRNVAGYEPPPLFSRLLGHVSFEAISCSDDWAALFRLVGDDTFGTDRVAIDPLFGRSVSNRRYVNWLSDLSTAPNTAAAFVKWRGERAGFFAASVDEDERTLHSVLGGVFRKYQDMGIGSAIIHGPMTVCRERGMRRFVTSISSNNFAVFRLYVLFGFSFVGARYVLRYFGGEGT